jgi:hypothetical protein
MRRSQIRLTGAVAVIGLATATSALAGVIYLNPAEPTFDPTAGALVAHARFKVSDNAWDMVLDRDATSGNGNDVGTRDLGNVTVLTSDWWNVTLAYLPSTGLTYTAVSDSGQHTGTLSWTGTAITGFDTIVLESRAHASHTQTRSLEVRDLAFAVGGGDGVLGIFPNLDVASVAGAGADVRASTFAWADFDLSQTAWTLTGRVRPTVTGTGPADNPGDNLRLFVELRDSGGVTAPESASLTLILTGALLMVRRWQRRVGTTRVGPLQFRPEGKTHSPSGSEA